MAVSPTISVRLPSDPRAPWVARQSMHGLEDYVPRSVLDDARLLVSELVTNSVRHGEGAAPIEVEAKACADSLHVEVADRGASERRGPPGRQQLGSGSGLLIVAKVANRWGVETGPSRRVWFELDTDPASDPVCVQG